MYIPMVEGCIKLDEYILNPALQYVGQVVTGAEYSIY